MNTPEHFDFWKYFSDDAAKIKDKLWTIASWLFTLLGWVLTFLAKVLKTDDLVFSEPKLGKVVSFVGIVLSTYTYWMITEYGGHIRTIVDKRFLNI